MRPILKATLLVLLLAAPVAAAPDAKPAAAVTVPAPAPAPAAVSAPAPAPAPSATVTAAPVAKPDQQVFWQVLLAELLKVFLIIAIPVLSTLVASLLRRWKINVEYQQVASIAGKAGSYAEHKALAALKDGLPRTSGAEKMKLALAFGTGLATQYKLPSKATEKLQELIESSLAPKAAPPKPGG